MNYLPVRLSTLQADVALNFKVYVKLPHKYVLYSRAGQGLEAESLRRFKKKKVRKLFIEAQDEPHYQSFLNERLQKAVDDPNASVEEKAQAASGAATNASDKVYEQPAERSSYEAARRAASGMLKILLEKEETLAAILKRDDQKDVDAVEKMRAHAVNTCSLAIRFGEYLGLQGEELENLGIAGLYHDVAYTQSSEEIQAVFFEELSAIDGARLGLYKEHPRQAVEMLQDKSFASAGVLDLIMTHEERVGSKGFPKALQKLTLAQEAHAICCHYDREVTCLGKEPSEVIENLLIHSIGLFNLGTLKKFKAFGAKMGF